MIYLSAYLVKDEQSGPYGIKLTKRNTGIAALTLAVRPDLSAAALKKILMDNATRLPALAGKVACGGMVNAYSSLRAALK